MTEGLERITTAALGLALDAASLRQQAIATNIANAGTPGYRPVGVSFEAQLDGVRRSLEARGRLDPGALDGVHPEVVLVPSPDGAVAPTVSLDLEVAHLAANTVAYQALAKGLARHFALLSLAVSDGKG